MKDKIYTVSVIGCGSRGAETYGRIMADQKERYKIVALCDIDSAKLDKYGEIFGVAENSRFSSEEEFFKEKRSEVLIIATLDKEHVRQCLAALEKGYDVLLEKPITDSEEECRQLLAAQKKYGGKVVVCHVLRYAPAYVKLKELLEEGRVGELTAIDATEQVGYWHQAHSYVRGNWRRGEDTSPMILAKCCHDLDLIQYYAKSRCKSLSSVGELRFFKKENQPADAADRCAECIYSGACAYSAERIYIENWKAEGCPENKWPYNVITSAIPLTEEELERAVKEGPYGRCVFACDNDVVDHQIVMMTFENGVKACLKMIGFTAGGGRIIKFYGTQGEIVFDESENYIEIKPFGKAAEVLNTDELAESGFSHGGGDRKLIDSLYGILNGDSVPETSLEASIESHLMGISAENSRLAGGAAIEVR